MGVWRIKNQKNTPISVLNWENYCYKLKMKIEKIGKTPKLEKFLIIFFKMTEKAS